jgi:hypothetical protein
VKREPYVITERILTQLCEIFRRTFHATQYISCCNFADGGEEMELGQRLDFAGYFL